VGAVAFKLALLHEMLHRGADLADELRVRLRLKIGRPSGRWKPEDPPWRPPASRDRPA